MIGQELALAMRRAGGASEEVFQSQCVRVQKLLSDNDMRFTPEIAAQFSELLPFCVDDLDFAKVIGHAEIVLWDEQIFQAAICGHEVLIGDAPPPLLPHPPQIWIRDRVYKGTDECEFLYGVVIRCVLSQIERSWGKLGVQICDIRTKPDVGLHIVPTDTLLLEEHPLEPGDSASLAAILFLRQEWVRTEPVHFARAFRRKYEREHREVPAVKTVLLRRAAKSNDSQSVSQSDREYSCQWIVSGHWRRQYYPSKGVHAPKYIAPYPKGPEGKPLRVPRSTIYLAQR
jgi:hypothetical protein